MKIGFLGLGDLGTAIAERLARCGNELTIWNRTPGRGEALLKLGAVEATSPKEVGRHCDQVHLCLTNFAAVESVLGGSNGLLTGRWQGLVVDHSTLHPDEARMCAKLARDAGAGYIDAPVSGGAAGALQGTLAAMVGGSAAQVAQAECALRCIARSITLLGDVGAGQVAKLCNQIVNFATVAALAEAFATADANGVDSTLLPTAMTGGFADSNMLREYARGLSTRDKPHMTLMIDHLASFSAGHGDLLPRGKLDMPLKDIKAAAQLADRCNVPLSVTRKVEEIFERANKGQS